MTNTIEVEAQNRLTNNVTLIDALGSTSRKDESDFYLTVINDAERGRWTAVLGAEGIGELSYRYIGGRVVLLYAWVDHSYRKHGVATELIASALADIRRSSKKITIICPVVGAFIARHPEYADLIDKAHPGSGAYPQPGDKHHHSGETEAAALANDLEP